MFFDRGAALVAAADSSQFAGVADTHVVEVAATARVEAEDKVSEAGVITTMAGAGGSIATGITFSGSNSTVGTGKTPSTRPIDICNICRHTGHLSIHCTRTWSYSMCRGIGHKVSQNPIAPQTYDEDPGPSVIALVDDMVEDVSRQRFGMHTQGRVVDNPRAQRGRGRQ